jgi:hypothetical protein
MTLRELVNLIKFDVDEASLRTAEKRIDSTISGLDRFGRRASILLTVPILALGAFSTKVASDTNEMRNKFVQVFGELGDDATTFAETLSKSVGRYVGDVMEGMGAFQSMFVGLGYANEEAAEMSKRMQTLAIDFGSFNNLTDKDSIGRFISAMAGSSQVLDMYGINIKDAAMNAELQAMGLAKTTQQATEAEKALARLNIIEKTMTRQGAVGDAVRTMNEFANSSRAFFSTIKNVVAGFGEKLLPVLNKFFALGTLVLNWVDELNDSTKITIMIFAGLLALMGPLAIGAAGLLTVVKTLMMFSTFIGGLAGLKGALLMALQPQFLLIAAAILVAVAALALFIEDVVTWVQGGDSLIGKLLGPWETWAANLREIFSLAVEDFGTFVKALGIALVDGLSDLSDKLEKSTFGKIIKWVSLMKPAELLGSALGTLQGTIGTIPTRLSMAANEQRILAASTTGQSVGVRDVRVDSKITMQVPSGSTQAQMEAVESAAKRAVRVGISEELQRLLDDEGGVR